MMIEPYVPSSSVPTPVPSSELPVSPTAKPTTVVPNETKSAVAPPVPVMTLPDEIMVPSSVTTPWSALAIGTVSVIKTLRSAVTLSPPM